MDKMVELFEEFILKAITLTEAAIAQDPEDGERLANFTENRERLLAIIDSISRKITWSEIDKTRIGELEKKIEFIKKLDEKLLTKLQEHKLNLKQDIEKAFRQKENIKGYNLTDLK